MKSLIFTMALICSNLSYAEGVSTINNPFKVGDCFNYYDFSDEGKFAWVVGKIDDLSLYNFEYKGTLYAKTKGDNHNKFVTYKFDMPYSKQLKFKKIACPKSLPKKSTP